MSSLTILSNTLQVIKVRFMGLYAQATLENCSFHNVTPIIRFVARNDLDGKEHSHWLGLTSLIGSGGFCRAQ